LSPRKSCNRLNTEEIGWEGEYPFYNTIKKWANKGCDPEYLLEKTESQIASTY